MVENDPQSNTGQLLYDAEQASARLGLDSKGKPLVSAYWLKRKAAARLIPCTSIGASARWSEQQLLDLIEQRSKGPGAPVCDRCRKPR
ncbi:MAG TPA: hypothetical protein VFA06_03115 [Actinocrinis sp.]|uniref:hypothetical protein n=1 Tax=Actinocrinis sp. TaxID=1920516 RepID=UPI002D28521D|nr:hypothetical protein [Actinocrinis sp.]HZU54839.1 hypothetical protein [Actinocrinis sp.]